MILFDRTRIFMIVMIGADRLIKIMTYHEDHENLRSMFLSTDEYFFDFFIFGMEHQFDIEIISSVYN